MSLSSWTVEDAEVCAKAHREHLAALKKERRRLVRLAVKTGQKVGYDLGTLLEDGHSLATVRKVYRAR